MWNNSANCIFHPLASRITSSYNLAKIVNKLISFFLNAILLSFFWCVLVINYSIVLHFVLSRSIYLVIVIGLFLLRLLLGNLNRNSGFDIWLLLNNCLCNGLLLNSLSQTRGLWNSLLLNNWLLNRLIKNRLRGGR